jgi:endonuclease/exonuclease/phosphatase family metal-dependent hydrolase
MISVEKRADISALIESKDPDIISICETWLTPLIKDEEIIPKGYIVSRRDRPGSGHGGVLIAIKQDLKSSRLTALDCPAEAVWASLDTGKERLLIGSAYRRPKSSEEENKELQHSLSLASEIQDNYDATLLMGDFNLMADWGDTPKPKDKTASEFLSSFYDLFLVQLVLQATRIVDECRSILDLVLCSVPDLICNLDIIPGVSDHLAVAFTISINPNRPAAPRRHVYNYKRANWSKLSAMFVSKLPVNFAEFADAGEAWLAWKAAFFDCVDSCVPKCFIKQRKHHPWITPEIVKKIKKRNRFFKKCSDKPTVEKWEKYRIVRNSIRRMIRDAYDNFLHTLGLPANRKKLWAFIRSRLRKLSAPAFMVNGSLTTNIQNICEAFSDHFQLNFNDTTRQSDILPPPLPSISDLTDFDCSENEIKAFLSAIKADAATGPDNIPAIILRTCAAALAPSLCSLFNLLLSFGEVPGDWKQANITPIHKKGDKAAIANYRPISVTSLVSKCMERAVTLRLLGHMKENNFINDNQHGFLPGRSCTTLLSHVIDECFVGLNKKNVKQIDLIALDWAKAFDCIPHDRLFAKLSNYHVRGNVLKWLKSFLSGRTQSVVFGGGCSASMPVPSGVPQGCVTSPLLFTIFMLDLPACVNSPLAQYADDCTIYREISTPADCEALQSDLLSIGVWCKLNEMALNVLKCVHLCITRSPSPVLSSYNIDNETVPRCLSLKLLGVIISSDLKWNLQTEYVRCSAMRVLGMLARSFGRRSSSSMKVLYTSLVRSVITYGMPAWHPSSSSNIEKLEQVQGRATSMMMRMKRSDRSVDRAGCPPFPPSPRRLI